MTLLRFLRLPLLALAPCLAWSLPLLQLDVVNGTYVWADQTVHANQDPFTLLALFDTNQVGLPSGTYYLSAAVAPKVAESSPGVPSTPFGSFTVNGVTYSATAAMQYGGPPVDNANIFPNLPTHGIYATWFAEIPFVFDASLRTISYNIQNQPGGLQVNANGTMVYRAFTVNTAGMNPGYSVHFDLYDEVIQQKRNRTDYSLNFAPFSHDAESRVRVPDESGAWLLLGGVGLLLGWLRSTRKPSAPRA